MITLYCLAAVNVPALTIVGLNSTTSSAWPFCFWVAPKIAEIPSAGLVIALGRSSPDTITVVPSKTRVTVSEPATRINGVD
jgi:hypothetical protein